MPDITHQPLSVLRVQVSPGCARLLLLQQIWCDLSKRVPPAATRSPSATLSLFTCFDFHMFFPSSLIFSSRSSDGAPAFHYCSQHFSAYTSDRAGVRAGRSGGQHAVDITPWPFSATDNNLTARPAQTATNGCPQRPAITRDRAARFCARSPDVTRGERTHRHTNMQRAFLTLMQSQASFLRVRRYFYLLVPSFEAALIEAGVLRVALNPQFTPLSCLAFI